jgi:enoyl-CoA hydratase/carnithine racemase
MSDIIVGGANGVSAIRINRPEKKNALTRGMYTALAEALRAGDADPAIGAHLILGVPGAFSAGNDMADFLAMAETGELGREVLTFLEALVGLAKPLIIGVDGLAVGIGTTMLMHADLVLATNRSQFRTPFVDLGLVPEGGSSMLAPRLMGHVRAFELLCLGVPFDAATALSVGLINRIVGEETIDVEAATIAAAVASKPREAMAISRSLLKAGGQPSRSDLVAHMASEVRAFAARLESPEAKAAFEAFFRRKPG